MLAIAIAIEIEMGPAMLAMGTAVVAHSYCSVAD